MTLTPAPSPTLDDAGRCAAFAAIGTPEEGVQAILGRHGRVSFSWRYPVAGESATLTVFREREPALTRTLTLSGTALTIAVVPFRALWGPGRYSWRLAPNDAAGAPLAGCMAAGSFTLLLRDRLSRTDSAGPQMSD